MHENGEKKYKTILIPGSVTNLRINIRNIFPLFYEHDDPYLRWNYIFASFFFVYQHTYAYIVGDVFNKFIQ